MLADREGPRLLVVSGSPGMGKSLLANDLACSCLPGSAAACSSAESQNLDVGFPFACMPANRTSSDTTSSFFDAHMHLQQVCQYLLRLIITSKTLILILVSSSVWFWSSMHSSKSLRAQHIGQAGFESKSSTVVRRQSLLMVFSGLTLETKKTRMGSS